MRRRLGTPPVGRPGEGHRAAVRARIAAAPQHPVGLAPHDLPAAEGDAAPAAHGPQIVSPPAQLREARFRKGVLHGDGAAGVGVLDLEAGPVQGLLGVAVVVEQRDHHLQVTLGLHESAHHAEGPVEAAVVPCDQTGDDGVVRALARRHGVGVVPVEAEVVPPVLEREAEAFGNQARAESHVVAVDERAGVALGVDGHQLHGVRAGEGHAVPKIGSGALGVDLPAPLAGVALGQQLLDGDLAEVGITHPATGVREGETHALDQQVQPVRSQRLGLGRVEAPEQAEGQQRSEPLTVRRTLPHPVSAVAGGDGLHPVGAVGGEVALGEDAAVLPDHGGDRRRDLAPVERVGAALGHPAQGARQGRIAEQLARPGGAAVDQQLATATVRSQLAIDRGPPQARGHGGDREALLGQLDGRRQHLGQRQPPVPGDGVLPARAGARHRDRMGVEGRPRIAEAHGPEPRQVEARRCAAGSVEGAHLSGGRVVEEPEAVAADARAAGLGDAEGGGGRHRRVGGVAARGQHAQARGRGQRLAGGHHGAATDHGRALGLEVRGPSAPGVAHGIPPGPGCAAARSGRLRGLRV